ncbi:MAG: mevalonate kinase [Phycisphaerae bacterium]
MTDTTRQVKLFVSGRLCLFGEHSDWAAERGNHNGYCLVVGTDQGFSAVAGRSDEFRVDTPVPGRLGRPTRRRRQMTCPATAEMLREAAQDQREYFRYCAGVAYYIVERHGAGGIDLRITSMDLPLRKGVSSSAAICILVARAFNETYRMGLSTRELMELAYEGEKLTGSQCGRMDQACIYGKTPVLLTFDQSSGVGIEPMHPGRPLHLFFVDLAGEKDTVRILRSLNAAYASAQQLRRALGPRNEQTVNRAAEALRSGDAEELGQLMTAAQEDFDRLVAPHCPEQLTSPILHHLLQWEPLQMLVYGGKGVGSQGDGVAQFVARSKAARSAAMGLIRERYPQMRCFPLTMLPADSRRDSQARRWQSSGAAGRYVASPVARRTD